MVLEGRRGHIYRSVQEKIQAIRNPFEYAGYLEIAAVSVLAKLQIRLYDKTPTGLTYRLIAKIPQASFGNRTPITILYTPESTIHAGHFDLLLPRDKTKRVNLCNTECDDRSIFANMIESCTESVSFEHILDPSSAELHP